MMMWLTGNKNKGGFTHEPESHACKGVDEWLSVQGFAPPKERNLITKKATAVRRWSFTFVELMLTVSALSLATTFLYRTYLSLLDNFNLCSAYLEATLFLQNKLWEVEKKLQQNDLSSISSHGEFKEKNKSFTWNLEILSSEDIEDLYKVNLDVNLKQARQIILKHNTYLAQ